MSLSTSKKIRKFFQKLKSAIQENLENAAERTWLSGSYWRESLRKHAIKMRGGS